MLSKRNLAMMMTMFIVVLVLFLSSAVLKGYFNDYYYRKYDFRRKIDYGECKKMLQFTIN